MKWCEVALRNQESRYEVLSQFAKEQGIENQPHFILATEENWQESVQNAMSTMDSIRIGPGLSGLILKMFNSTELEVRHLGSSDCLIFEAGKWWPRSAAFKGLVHALAEIGEGFHLGTGVLVVGTGGLARVAIAALFREGFTNFTIVARDVGRAERLMAQLRRTHLGAKFKSILRENLILLPTETGVCVNTLPAVAENEFIPDLSYFNFLLPRGLVIDFTMEEGISPLVKEAQAIGAKALPGHHLFAHIDGNWLKMISGKSISIEKLSQKYMEKFQPKV
jgi:shikimate 5-dehydrogenase